MTQKIGSANELAKTAGLPAGEYGWHFAAVNDSEKIVLRDGFVVDDEGTWLPVIESTSICNRGYHASEHVLDALSYAPDGRSMSLVELRGIGERHDDKLVAQERRIIARLDVHPLLVQYAEGMASEAERIAKIAAEFAEGKRLDETFDFDADLEKVRVNFVTAVESATLSVLAAKKAA